MVAELTGEAITEERVLQSFFEQDGGKGGIAA
jgi:hypothetical protein